MAAPFAAGQHDAIGPALSHETRSNPAPIVARLLDAIDRVAFRSCYSADRQHCTVLRRDLTEAAEIATFATTCLETVKGDDRTLATRVVSLACHAQDGPAAATNVLNSPEWCHVPALLAFAVLPQTYLSDDIRRELTAAYDAETERQIAALYTEDDERPTLACGEPLTLDLPTTTAEFDALEERAASLTADIDRGMAEMQARRATDGWSEFDEATHERADARHEAAQVAAETAYRRDVLAEDAPADEPSAPDTCDLCKQPIGEDFRQLGTYGIVCYDCHKERTIPPATLPALTRDDLELRALATPTRTEPTAPQATDPAPDILTFARRVATLTTDTMISAEDAAHGRAILAAYPNTTPNSAADPAVRSAIRVACSIVAHHDTRQRLPLNLLGDLQRSAARIVGYLTTPPAP